MPTIDYPWAIPYWSHPTNIYTPAGHGGVPNRPRAWCLHTPEEPAGDNYPGTPIWFAKPNVGGSTHYYVEAIEDPNRRGYCKVYQCVLESYGAIANGKTADKPWPSWADRGTSLNWQTLSVEIEGYAASIHQTLTPMQLMTVADLIVHRAQAYNIPLDREHIIGHYQVASNRTDPGVRFPWDELMTRVLERWLGKPEPIPEPEEEEELEGIAIIHMPPPEGGAAWLLRGRALDYIPDAQTYAGIRLTYPEIPVVYSSPEYWAWLRAQAELKK